MTKLSNAVGVALAAATMFALDTPAFYRRSNYGRTIKDAEPKPKKQRKNKAQGKARAINRGTK
jgi:hypothetical protein